MSARVLTPGHIKAIEQLWKKDYVLVGLLTAKAMKGYKKEIVPFKDRKFILEKLGVRLVAQDSLDPFYNLKKYKATALASGDGFEPCEKEAAKKLGIKLINIKLRGEKKKKYSSSKIIHERN